MTNTNERLEIMYEVDKKTDQILVYFRKIIVYLKDYCWKLSL